MCPSGGSPCPSCGSLSPHIRSRAWSSLICSLPPSSPWTEKASSTYPVFHPHIMNSFWCWKLSFSVGVQWASCVRLLVTSWPAACQDSLSLPSPGVCPSPCSLYWWYHLALSSSDALFSFYPHYLSQHQGLFQWVRCSHQVTKILELQLHHQSFQWVFRVDFL